MELYDEILQDKTLYKRKKAMQDRVLGGGIYRINPETFEYSIYVDSKSLRKDGYSTGNVFYACRHFDSIRKGYLWRFGSDVDLSSLEETIKSQVPEYYSPIQRTNIYSAETSEFPHVFSAREAGYNIKELMTAIREGTKYLGFYWDYKI